MLWARDARKEAQNASSDESEILDWGRLLGWIMGDQVEVGLCGHAPMSLSIVEGSYGEIIRGNVICGLACDGK